MTKIERWKPEEGERYWYISNVLMVAEDCWDGVVHLDEERYNAGNCFKTEEDAGIAAVKVKALLRSLQDNGETLQDSIQDKSLPKLTAEVFDRPDCPEWARYAAVDKYEKAMWYEDEPKALGGVFWNSKRGQIKEIPGKWDASDWQNSLIKRPAKLPGWCKAGEWVYLSNEEYDKIESIDGFGVNLASGAIINKKYIHEEAVSARIRPYNADEMRGLVGKVLERYSSAYLVISYAHDDLATTVYIEGKYLSADNLLRDFLIDGNPAGVLEHLEDGEWVQ